MNFIKTHQDILDWNMRRQKVKISGVNNHKTPNSCIDKNLATQEYIQATIPTLTVTL
jgi:hypothetical protein